MHYSGLIVRIHIKIAAAEINYIAARPNATASSFAETEYISAEYDNRIIIGYKIGIITGSETLFDIVIGNTAAAHYWSRLFDGIECTKKKIVLDKFEASLKH